MTADRIEAEAAGEGEEPEQATTAKPADCGETGRVRTRRERDQRAAEPQPSPEIAVNGLW